MGTIWSQWLEEGNEFHKQRLLDGDGTRAFYVSLRATVTAIVNTTEEMVNAEESKSHVQLILERWSREADILYRQASDLPLVLDVPNELNVEPSISPRNEATDASVRQPAMTANSREENTLRGLCSDKYSTSESIHQALQGIAATLSEREFLSALTQYPRACRLFITQRVHAYGDVSTPIRLLTMKGRHDQAADLVGKLAYTAGGDGGGDTLETKKMRLSQMRSLLLLEKERMDPRPSSHQYAQSVTRAMVDEMLALLDTQYELEQQFQVTHLIGRSLIETVHQLLFMYPTYPQALAAAAAVAQQYAISPRQFWWAVLKVLPQTQQWSIIVVLAAAVPPPFGYLPIAEALLEDGEHLELAPELVKSISSPHQRTAVLALFNRQVGAHAAHVMA